MRVAERTGGAFVGRSEHRDHARPDRGTQMHRPGIVRDERAADRQHARKRGHVGAADERQQTPSAAAEGALDVGGRRAIGCRSNHHRLNAIAGERARHIREALSRPPLRPSIGCAGREGDQRRVAVPTGLTKGDGRSLVQAGRNGDARLHRAIGKTERVHQLLVVLGLVQARWRDDGPREEGTAEIGRITPSLTNPGGGRPQRGAHRIAQQQHGIAPFGGQLLRC